MSFDSVLMLTAFQYILIILSDICLSFLQDLHFIVNTATANYDVYFFKILYKYMNCIFINENIFSCHPIHKKYIFTRDSRK